MFADRTIYFLEKALFKSKPTESKRFTKLVDAICKELHLDKKMVLYFINADLERVNKIVFPIQNIRLSELEVEIQKYVKSETELEQEIAKKNALLESRQNKIGNLRSSIDKKTRMLAEHEETIVQLQNKLDSLSKRLKEVEKKKKILSYDIMMKRHSVKETDNRTFQYLKLFLLLISILAVILAVFFILKK
jgi:chromosome segregation ATPase